MEKMPYQAGLASAVDRFLGHGPAVGSSRVGRWAGGTVGTLLTGLGFDRCRMAAPDPARGAFLSLLSATESGRSGLPGRALRAAYLSHLSKRSHIVRFPS